MSISPLDIPGLPKTSFLFDVLPHFPPGVNFYAVRIGKVPGVYLSHEECEAQVHQHPGNCHKKFVHPEVACAYTWGQDWAAKGPWHFSLVYSIFEGSALGEEPWVKQEMRSEAMLEELVPQCHQAARMRNPAIYPHAISSLQFFLHRHQRNREVFRRLGDPPITTPVPSPFDQPNADAPPDLTANHTKPSPPTFIIPSPSSETNSCHTQSATLSTSSSNHLHDDSSQIEDLSCLMSAIGTSEFEDPAEGFSIVAPTTIACSTSSHPVTPSTRSVTPALSPHLTANQNLSEPSRILSIPTTLLLDTSLTEDLPEDVIHFLAANRFDERSADIVASIFCETAAGLGEGTLCGRRHLHHFITLMGEAGLDSHEALQMFNMFKADL